MERDIATTTEHKAHDQWFRAKIEATLTSKAPTIPHDQVTAELQGILDAKRDAASRPVRQNASLLNKKRLLCVAP